MFVRQMDAFFRNSTVKEKLQTGVVKRNWSDVKTVPTKTGQHASSSFPCTVTLLLFDLISDYLFPAGKQVFPNSLTAYLSFLLRKTAPLTKLNSRLLWNLEISRTGWSKLTSGMGYVFSLIKNVKLFAYFPVLRINNTSSPGTGHKLFTVNHITIWID